MLALEGVEGEAQQGPVSIWAWLGPRKAWRCFGFTLGFPSRHGELRMSIGFLPLSTSP